MSVEGANLALSALQNRTEMPMKLMDSLVTSYTKMKEVENKQKELDEERRYHKSKLTSDMQVAGFKPDPNDPNGFIPDPAQLQIKQAAARAEAEKVTTEALKNRPHDILTQILAGMGFPTQVGEMNAYRAALAATGGGVLPETGLPPNTVGGMGGPGAWISAITRSMSKGSSFKGSSSVGKYSRVA